MRLFSTNHYFNYQWEQVTAANWQKYPNEISTHVVSVDTLNREIDLENNVLRSERLIACKQPVPKWLSCLIGGEEYSYIREISEVDLNTKQLIMKSANLTMSHLLLCKETVIYKPDLELPQSRTLFYQQAEFTAFASFSRICDKIEEWSVERFGQNAIKGKLGFESVLKALTQSWEESGVIVNDVSNLILKDLNEVTEKTSDILGEVSKLGNVFRK